MLRDTMADKYEFELTFTVISESPFVKRYSPARGSSPYIVFVLDLPPLTTTSIRSFLKKFSSFLKSGECESRQSSRGFRRPRMSMATS